ncbi:hypothetical protein SGRIM128S_01764 [Streptomyces griseomycini]
MNKWKQFRAVATRYDKRDYIFNGTLTVTAVVIWLRSFQGLLPPPTRPTSSMRTTALRQSHAVERELNQRA